MSEPFMGSTEECLRHFVQAHPEINEPKTKEFRVRNTISRLLDVSQATAYDWFCKFNMPNGERLLRLRYFLELNGYRLSDRHYASEVLRVFSNHLALQAISLADAASYIGLLPSAVLSIAMCRQGTSPQSEQKLVELVELNQEAAAEKLKAWQATIESFGFAQPPQEEIVAPVVQATEPVVKEVDKDVSKDVIEILARLIQAACPLAELILSDNFSAEDRCRLRELTGNGRTNKVFELSNSLNRLCGERARKEM